VSRLLLAVAVLASSAAFAQADAGVRARPTVAVLYFDVPEKSDELATFRKGFAQMLISDLVADERLQVVERARLEEVLTELKISNTAAFDPASALKVGKLLSARFQVTGNILPLPKGELLFQAEVLEVERGAKRKSVRVKAKLEDIYEAEQSMAKTLIAQLVAEGALPSRDVSGSTGAAAPKAPPKLKYASAVKYAKALDAGDKKDPAAKKALLTEVVKEEPDFVLARVDLANLTQ
jgi:TolB-like protein